jgi:hypothetical protein
MYDNLTIYKELYEALYPIVVYTPRLHHIFRFAVSS